MNCVIYCVTFYVLTVCAPGYEGNGVTCTICVLSNQPGSVSGTVHSILINDIFLQCAHLDMKEMV